MTKRRSNASAKKSNKNNSQESLDFFLASLNDPQKPAHCGRCLYGALLSSIDEGSEVTPDNLPLHLRRNVDFWRTLYGFLVSPRTDFEVDELLGQLSRCSCQISDKRIEGFHQAAERAESGSIQRNWIMHFAPEDRKASFTNERIAFVIKICCVLYAGLSDSGVKSVAKGIVQTWPNTPPDLMPFGADQLVQTLLQWHRHVPDNIIFQLVRRILHVCRFALVPSLAKFKFSHLIVETARDLVDFAADKIKNPGELDLALGSPTSIAPFVMRYNYTIKAVIEYFREILEDMPHDTRADLFFGCETKAMQVFSMLLYTSSYPTIPVLDSEETTHHFAVFCQEFYRFFHMHLYPHPNYPVHPMVVAIDSRAFPPPPSIRSTPRTVAFYIGNFHEETRCTGYGCPNSIQTAGKNFQRCSRCQVVSYCSKECQIRAWREEKYPHKRICPILRLLIDTAGGLDMFLASKSPNPLIRLAGGMTHVALGNWEAAKVPEDLLETVSVWAKWVSSTRNMPDGSWWHPGYEDYNDVIKCLSLHAGAENKPRYMNRLARWPSEVAKIKAMLEELPYWDQDIVF